MTFKIDSPHHENLFQDSPPLGQLVLNGSKQDDKPDWAVPRQYVDQLPYCEPRARLATKDGRVVSNAVVVSVGSPSLGGISEVTVRLDFGGEVVIDEHILPELFHKPVWCVNQEVFCKMISQKEMFE